MNLGQKKKIYLDYASSAPIDLSVEKLISKINRDFTGNSNSIHTEGVKSKNILEGARAEIARAISAHPDEIIFTGSGTESDAIAVLGVVNNYRLLSSNKNTIPHIVTTNIEHPAILENCKMLESRGESEVTYIAVEENGIVNPKKIREAIKENTILVTVMYANNEIGTIQPIREIAKEIRHFRKHKDTENSFVFPLFHTDAAQAMNYLETENIERLGVDMMSFNSSKIYGPKGAGVLYKKRGLNLAPVYAGGGQEFGLRSGTENVASIAGVARALELANKIKENEFVRLTKLRDDTIEKLFYLKEKTGYEIILNGDKEIRLPNNINITVVGISSELLVVELDAKGIAVSERSACAAGNDEGSHVIRALRENNNDSIRITLGRATKKSDLDYLVSFLEKILLKYKQWK